MTDYLFALWDGGGAVPPVLSVAEALTRRGHDVRVLADPVLAGEVEAAGAAHVTWTHAPHRTVRRPETDVIRDWEARTPVGGFARMRDRLMFGAAGAFARDVLDELERRPADVVATEMMLSGAVLAAEAADVPSAVLATTVNPLPTPGRPPFGPGFAPARGPLGRARDAVVGAASLRAWNRALPALNAARAEQDLEPVFHALDQIRDADRVLILSSEAFDVPLGEVAANVRYVGPRLEDPQWTGEWSPPHGDDPLVLVGLSSTFQDQHALLREAVEALGRLPVRGLVTTGPAVDPAVVAASHNVAVLQAAPHAEVLQHAAAVVTHGGHGTVIKALAAGVPLVVLPMGRDQADVAARVETTGTGIRLKPGASAEKIAAAVRTVLDDPSYRAAAGHLAAAIAAEIAEDHAVAELEALPQIYANVHASGGHD